MCTTTKAVRILRETLRLPANLPRLMLHAQAHVHHGEGELGSMTNDDKSVRVVVVCGTSFFLRARPEGMLPPRPGVAAAAASPPADEEELRLGHAHAQGPGKGPERSSCSGVPSAAVHLKVRKVWRRLSSALFWDLSFQIWIFRVEST